MIDNYVAYWGEKNLTRWPSKALASAKIPQASKDFLVCAGMPPLQKGWAHFTWNTSLPQAKDGKRVLGMQYNTPLLLSSEGYVVRERIPPHPGGLPGVDETWLNSSVVHFAQFITEFHKFFRSDVHREVANLVGPDRESNVAFQHAVEVLWGRLMGVDPSAEQGYWAPLYWETQNGITD